jgi:hypothetical protein
VNDVCVCVCVYVCVRGGGIICCESVVWSECVDDLHLECECE